MTLDFPGFLFISFIPAILHTLSRQLRLRNSEFFNLGTTDIWGQYFSVVGKCPVHCKICSSIPGLYVVETVALLPSPNYDNQKSLQALLNALWVQNCFLSITSSLAVSSHLCNQLPSPCRWLLSLGFFLRSLVSPFLLMCVSTWILSYYLNHPSH